MARGGLVGAVLGMALGLGSAGMVKGQNCFSGWSHQTPVTVNNGGSALSDYQVRVVVNTAALVNAGQMLASGDDIRFSSPDDCCTPLCYSIESGMNTANTVIWVKVPAVAGGTSTLNLIHGNTGAVAGANPSCTFDLWDDFSGNALDLQKWEVRGNPAQVQVSGGTLTFTGNSNWEYIRSVANFNTRQIVQMRYYQPGAQPSFGPLVGFTGTDHRYTHRFSSGNLLGTTYDPDVVGGNAWADSNYPGIPGGTTVPEDVEFEVGLNGSNQVVYTRFCNVTQSSCNNNTQTFIDASGSSFYIGFSSYAAPYTGVVDEVRVRKYASPEPVTSVGAAGTWTPSTIALPDTSGYCAGGSVVLDAGAGFSGYLWNTGDTTGTISVSSAGLYTVAALSAGCLVRDTVEVVEYAAPSVQITPNDTASCGVINYPIHAGAGYAAYLWSNGATTASMVPSGYGLQSVTVTDGNGCTASDTILVSPGVMAAPVITVTGANPACAGDTVWLDAGAGYASYNWNPGSGQMLGVLGAGTYTVTVTDVAGCSSSSSVQVSFFAAPLVVISINGGVMDAGVGFVSYQWYLSGVPVPGATSQTYAAAVSGSYTVVVTDVNGCAGESGPVSVVGRVDGIAGGSLVVAPNPTRGDFRVKVDGLGVAEAGVVEVMDMAGRMVYRGEVAVNGGVLDAEVKAGVGDAGMYLVRVLVEGTV